MNHDLFIGLHILAVIAWMAGMLYLPRLFVYHCRATPGSEMDETFKVMERRLYKGIINPAAIAVFVLGACLVWIDTHVSGDVVGFLKQPWMATKLVALVLMYGYHGFLGGSLRRFAQGRNTRSEKFWRFANEVPFVLAIVIVLAATTKFGG